MIHLINNCSKIQRFGKALYVCVPIYAERKLNIEKGQRVHCWIDKENGLLIIKPTRLLEPEIKAIETKIKDEKDKKFWELQESRMREFEIKNNIQPIPEDLK